MEKKKLLPVKNNPVKKKGMFNFLFGKKKKEEPKIIKPIIKPIIKKEAPKKSGKISKRKGFFDNLFKPSEKKKKEIKKIKLKKPIKEEKKVNKKSKNMFNFLFGKKKKEEPKIIKPIIKKEGFFKKLFAVKKPILEVKQEEAKEIPLEMDKKEEQKEIEVKEENKEKVKPIKKSPKVLKTFEGELKFFKTGIAGLDDLLNKGVPEGASILVEGGPGSGKTIFCLALLKAMCKEGKKVLYMSFEEPEYRLRAHLKSFGTNAEELEKKGVLYIKRFNALDIARSVEALLSEAKRELLIDVQPVLIPQDFDPDIVLIDSLTSIGSAFSGQGSRFRIYMEQLFRYLESHEITSFLIRETSSPTHVGTSFVEKAEAVSFLSDGIIALYNVFMPNGTRKRALEIIKMRGVSIDRKVVECEIKSGSGLVVYPNRILKGKYILT